MRRMLAPGSMLYVAVMQVAGGLIGVGLGKLLLRHERRTGTYTVPR
jgi:hypothetical protein